jgi:hypothetical protein
MSERCGFVFIFILMADQGVAVHGSRDVGMPYWYARIDTL